MGAPPATTLDRYRGVEPGPSAVDSALSDLRARMLEQLQSFGDREWRAPSRCTEWTVHDVVRHIVDVAAAETPVLRGEQPRTADGRVDPRADPDLWLAATQGQEPSETLAEFERVANAERAAFIARAAAPDDDPLPGPYGPLHWTTIGAHVYWDTWLHERDITEPLGLGHHASFAEDRLAAMYALAVSSTTPTFFGTTVALTIELTGSAGGVYAVEAIPDANTTVRVAASGERPMLRAGLVELVDALAGRGPEVTAVVEGPADAIEPLALLRSFLLPA